MIDTEVVRAFIIDHYFLPKTALKGPDDEIHPRLVDARGVTELMDFVEETYDVWITEDDMYAFAEIFRTLDSIAAYDERKRAEASQVSE